MHSALRKQMKELCTAADYLTYMLGVADVEDVAELRMHLNRVQNAFAGKTNEQILEAMLRDPTPEEQPKFYLTTNSARYQLVDPNQLVKLSKETPIGEDGEARQEITEFALESQLQTGARAHIANMATRIALGGGMNLTGAQIPDLSKCFKMEIKS